jgi:NAD(P)H dehydrogenase (quinone)
MILVTGISGGLGGLIHEGLSADRELEVVGGTRAERPDDGRPVRRIDFDEPATLAEGFKGADVLVFVSAGAAEDDVVLARHGAVVDAAAAAGVRQVIYTSLSGSGDSLTFALAHRWTEARLAEAPFDVTVLRNGLYTQLLADVAASSAASAAETGVFPAALGAGRISVVDRRDLADVAVRVAAETQRDLAAGGPGRHAGRTYELEGVAAVGGEELAGVLAEALGRTVGYRRVPIADVRAALEGAGLPPYVITHSLSIFSNVTADLLEARGSDLPGLLPDGAGPRPVGVAFAEALFEGEPAAPGA